MGSSFFRTSPHFAHEKAQPSIANRKESLGNLTEADMSYAQRVVKALWERDSARMDRPDVPLSQSPIATMRLPK